MGEPSTDGGDQHVGDMDKLESENGISFVNDSDWWRPFNHPINTDIDNYYIIYQCSEMDTIRNKTKRHKVIWYNEISVKS